jgi:hypothetical protein
MKTIVVPDNLEVDQAANYIVLECLKMGIDPARLNLVSDGVEVPDGSFVLTFTYDYDASVKQVDDEVSHNANELVGSDSSVADALREWYNAVKG